MSLTVSAVVTPVQDETQVGLLEPIQRNYEKPSGFEYKVYGVEHGYEEGVQQCTCMPRNYATFS